jgi:HTH-type transcriptional regulator / antitoxin HigA
MRPLDKEELKHMNADRLPGTFPDLAETWATLQHQVLLKPIRNEHDYQSMSALANELSRHIDGDQANPLVDLHTIVKDLIEAWHARQQVLIPQAEPREVLRHLLETHGLKQKDLADIASPTVVSDILAGRRAISKNVAKALAARFHADVSVFL